MELNKRIFTIDGNYFGHRTLGGLNSGDRINNLESKLEIEQFRAALNNSLIGLWNTFKPFCDNLIFCADSYSWRKEITPVKPYWVNDDRVLGYKEQRSELKEESSINYKNFNSILDEFVESLRNKIVVLKSAGLEGDDLIMLLSNRFKDTNIEMLVFCNDGDLNQTVNSNTIIFRNIKSKDAPFGEFVISAQLFSKLLNQNKDIHAKLLSSGNNLQHNSLFQLTLDGGKFNRKLGEGIKIAQPFTLALVKSICGDKKDNIFSIMGWKSTTGTKDFKLTENIIEKALAKLRYDELNEDLAKKIFSEPNLLTSLIYTLRENTNQTHVDIKLIGEHLKHNLKINILSEKNIPENYLNEFNLYFESYKDIIFNKSYADELTIKIVNTSTVLQDSLPDNLKIILNK
jgi:hypothetical protein